MDIYWIMVALIFLVSVPIQPHRSKYRTKTYLWIVFLMMLIVSGCRAFSVGADTKEYVRIFNDIDNLEILKKRYEIGFLLYAEILHHISKDPGILLIVSSAICVGTSCVLTYKYSKNPVLSMMLYILLGAYFSQMNAMRQTIALSITEASFMILIRKDGRIQRAVSAILILFATTFHTAAFVGFIPWLLIIRYNRTSGEYKGFTVSNMLRKTILIAVGVFGAYSVVLIVAIKILPQYAGYFRGTWSDANYNASLFNTLIQLTVAVVGAIVFKSKALNNPQRFAAIMLSLTIIFDTLSMRMEIWGRIAGMFSIYSYLLWIPEVTSEIHSARSRALLNTVVVFFSAAYMIIVLVYRPEWTLVVPYRFR